MLDIQQLFDRHVFGDQKSETFAWLLRKSRLNCVQRHCEIMKVCRRGRLGNARNVVQTMGPCFLVLMLLWSAKSSCGTSRQPENSFVVLQHGLSPRLSPHHVFPRCISTNTKFTRFRLQSGANSNNFSIGSFGKCAFVFCIVWANSVEKNVWRSCVAMLASRVLD